MKKQFKNLIESIIVSIVFLILLCFTVITFYGSVIMQTTANQKTGGLIGTGMMFLFTLIALSIIIDKGYEYWYIKNNAFHYKKLFRKSISIQIQEITKVKVCTIEDFMIWFSTKTGYTIFTEKTNITITVTKKIQHSLMKYYNLICKTVE